MKAYSILRNSVYTSIVLLIVTLTACSPTRYLAEHQALVKKVTLKGVDKDFVEQANLYIQNAIRPNSRINLALYNLVNTKKGKYRTGSDTDRIRNVGEAPHILDSTLVEISRTQITQFLRTKGFFNAQVESDIEIKNKKAYVVFTADQGTSFKIRNIEYIVPDTAVRALYEKERAIATRIRPGNRYDRDSLLYERDQIVFRMMKKNGYYDYLRQYMRDTVDTNLNSGEANVRIYINNPENMSSHQPYTINNTFFTIRNSDAQIEGVPDSTVIDSQYYFKDYSLRFNTKALSKYVFFNKFDLYNIDNEDITYDRLYELNVFKNLKIFYSKTSDSTNRLNPRIEAVPLKRMSNRIEGEYTFNSGRNGFNISNTYTNRNLFGGAEQLEIKFRYGVLFDSRLSGPLFDRVFNKDIQIGANFILPKLLVPFPVKQLGKNGLSHTTISSSIQIFDQINAFSNRIFINSLTYNWVETVYKLHSLTPVNLEYREGRLDEAFKEQLSKDGYELYIQTNHRQYVNMGSQYSYTYNAIRLNSYDNFFYFKATADVGGFTLGLLDKILKFKKDTITGARTIFNQAYLQYAKTELDLRFYKSLGTEAQFVARINAGIAYPYKNTTILPFEKNFYAGGSSGIRAWQARTLGPGNYNRSILSSDTLRANLRNLDQLGEIKLESNLEYRFKLMNNFFGAKLKAATFTDFGNIWRIPGRKNDNPNGELKLNELFNQIAIGAGAGLRFDYEYFVFRFDAGIKVKDPQFQGSDQWVLRHLFDNKAFKANYENTNAPDTYRFVQYNFGIGMPF